MTSDLGNSGDVIWEQDQSEDGSLIFHPGSSFNPLPLAHSAAPYIGKPFNELDIFRIQGKRGVGEGGRKGWSQPRGDEGKDAVKLCINRLESDGDGGASCDEFEA